MRRLLVLAGLLLAALVIVACGGDDDGSGDGDSNDTTTAAAETTISKAELIEMADEICAASGDTQAQLQAELDSAASPAEAADVYDGLADVNEGLNEEISALPRPEGDEQEIEDMAAMQTEAVGLIRDLASAVRAEDQAEAQQIATELDRIASESGQAAEEYGFEVC